ncbi:MAG: hypothetical protein E6K29_17600 [Gammaproteobacteria bacterium]|nr:MAG: hypothetical protein E6K29_17600 [Gammaproteobacteria bacterium]
MIAAHYSQIRVLHIGCAAFSAAVFTLRGLLRIADVAIANHRALRILSYTVDTALMSAAHRRCGNHSPPGRLAAPVVAIERSASRNWASTARNPTARARTTPS